jgi:hypothetical protein
LFGKPELSHCFEMKFVGSAILLIKLLLGYDSLMLQGSILFFFFFLFKIKFYVSNTGEREQVSILFISIK